eukprot:GDKJ01050198.1.p1 GENE.GDKJ01050198.1~~GDKJ01050198.1.p1  ORF type:complete len:277 (-),score=58.64 GDKJ01050198.1:184-1014(-)
MGICGSKSNSKQVSTPISTLQTNKSERFYTIPDEYKSIEDIQKALRTRGLEASQLVIAVDCTQSNSWTGTRSFGGRNLHDITVVNMYQQAMDAIARTLAPFDSDQFIPVLGFGDRMTTDKSFFTFHDPNRPCHGFVEVLESYRQIIPSVILSGPTSFAPVIHEAIRRVAETREYTILLILTDGCVTARQATADAIVKASNYPLSIICIGLGDGPFDDMIAFDNELPARKFDNFQFVEYQKVVQSNPGGDTNLAFAVCALQEIPEQYKICVKRGLLG